MSICDNVYTVHTFFSGRWSSTKVAWKPVWGSAMEPLIWLHSVGWEERREKVTEPVELHWKKEVVRQSAREVYQRKNRSVDKL